MVMCADIITLALLAQLYRMTRSSK
jgi:hypothetical protein